MRIAYIISHLAQTGVNNVVSDLATLLTARAHSCVIFYFEERERPMSFSCDTHHLPSIWKGMDFGGFDVVHSHGLKPDLYVLMHRPIGGKTRFFSTLHCYVFADFFDLYGRLKGLPLAILYLLSKLRHDRLVTLSNDARKYYARFMPCSRLTTIYNTRVIDRTSALSEEERKEVSDYKGQSILIGMNCVLIYRKGVDLMLRALALLPSAYRLFIVGDGPSRDAFVRLAGQLGVSDRVTFAGQRQDAHRYLPYYDIYALPSRAEGFPLALLEAAAYGVKVVSSDLPTVRECFADGSVEIFPLASAPKALAEAILSASQNECLGPRLKKAFEHSYSPSVFAERHLDLYTS